jgi:hypothetical protein
VAVRGNRFADTDAGTGDDDHDATTLLSRGERWWARAFA